MPPAVLIYDAECPACRASALWLMKRALAAGATDLELLPSRSSVRRARYPAISEAACAAAMHLVVPAGDVFSGAEAVPEIVRRVPRWRWIAAVLALPGARGAAGRAYGWIADHRMRLRCPLRGGAGSQPR
jgi:predicted DCC family thiol-disulfide oxidoreductase YuxK